MNNNSFAAESFSQTVARAKLQVYMVSKTLLSCFVFQIFLVGFLFFQGKNPGEKFRLCFNVFFAEILSPLKNNNQGFIKRKEKLLHDFKPVLWEVAFTLKVTSLIYLTIPLTFFFFSKKAKRKEQTTFLRGSQIVTEKEFLSLLRGVETYLPIGHKIKMPVEKEVQQTMIIGSTGTGKSQLLNAFLEKIKERGDRAIIFDPKPEFIKNFYSEEDGDLIFNVIDDRCLRWSLFNDIHDENFSMIRTNISAISNSLIPEPVQGDPNSYFSFAARDVFEGVLFSCLQKNEVENKDIWNLLSAPRNILASTFFAIPEARAGFRHLEDEGKTASNILSTLMAHTKFFEIMQDINGDFSIKNWVKNQKKGAIFVVNTPKVRDLMKPALSLLIDLAGREILSLEDDPKRRIFFLIDEFGALQRLSSLIDLLTIGRSKGAALVLASQDLGRVKNLYGPNLVNTLVNNCSTLINLRINEPETASYLEKLYGEFEVIEPEKSLSVGPNQVRDSLSTGMREKKKSLVLASELSSLPDLHFYTRISPWPPVKSFIEYAKREQRQPSLILRKDQNPGDLSNCACVKEENFEDKSKEQEENGSTTEKQDFELFKI